MAPVRPTVPVKHASWFCCECLDGPQSYILNSHCPNCYHAKCGYCKVRHNVQERSLYSPYPWTVIGSPKSDGLAEDVAASQRDHGATSPNPSAQALFVHTSGAGSTALPVDTHLKSDDLFHHRQRKKVSARDNEAAHQVWQAAGILQRFGYWLLSPGLRQGTVRLKFVCACGAIVWDDYPESMCRMVQCLERDLNRFFRQRMNKSGAHDGGAFIRRFPATLSFCARAFRILFTSQKSSAESPDAEASTRPSAPQEVEETSFYLTCARGNSRIPTLNHTESAAVYSDLEYFDVLRALANPSRTLAARLFNPHKVVAIDYVKFELLFDNEHVEIRKAPDFPTDGEHYQPCKTDFEKETFCPWGPNTLLHFFERRHKCSHHPKILARIPRKLKEKLVVSDDGQYGIGWGMRLDSDVDRFQVGIMGIAGLAVSSLMGILWAKLHGNDVQGGTGLAQCLMMFVSFLVALRGLGSFVEHRS